MSTDELKDPREVIDEAIELSVQYVNQALVTADLEERDALLRDALHYIRDAQVHNQLLRGMP